MLGEGYILNRNKMTDKLISPLRNPYFAIIKISIITIFLLSLSVIIADAAVTLVYFRANPEEDNININWKTATEYDNAGFFVVRSLTELKRLILAWIVA